MNTKICTVIGLLVIAQVSLAVERIVPTDASGNLKYNDTHYRVENNRIIPTDAAGNLKYDQTHYRTEGKLTIPTYASGREGKNLGGVGHDKCHQHG